MGLCVLYYVEYSLYNVKKVGFFYLGWNYTLMVEDFQSICIIMYISMKFGIKTAFDVLEVLEFMSPEFK